MTEKTSTINEVLQYIRENHSDGKYFNLLTVANILGISPQTMDNAIDCLADNHIVEVDDSFLERRARLITSTK